MATRYTYQCPKQSYAVSLEMCLARQLGGRHRCAHCRNKPVQGEAVGENVAAAEVGTRERIAA